MKQKIIFWPYIFGLVIGLTFLLPLTPLTLIVRILGLIFLPGILLVNIFRPNIEGQALDRTIFYLATGLVYNLILSLLAILGGINITFLEIIYFFILAFMIVLSLILALRRPVDSRISDLNLKQIFQLDNLVFLVPLAVTFIILIVIQSRGASFDGDPTYHLAIMRKAIENNPLGINSLSFVKNQPHPAYAIMIWPVLLALMAKINQLNIFSLWNQIPSALFLLVSLVWTWLFYKVTNQKTVAALTSAIFLIFTFYPDGYLYTRLAVPDTLSYLLLMPLAIGLTLDYLLNKWNIRLMVLISLLLLCTGFIHLTQYVYFFIIISFFTLWYLIFHFKKNGLEVLKRTVLLILLNLAILAPFFLWLQLQTGIMTRNMAYYGAAKIKINYMDSFAKFKTFTKYAYLALPLVLLFIRKSPKIILFWSLMFAAPIIYHVTFLKNLMYNIFSFVFVDRLYSNTTWYFAILGLIIGSLIALIAQVISHLIQKNKSLTIIINSFLALVTVVLIWGQFRFNWLSHFFKVISSRGTDRVLDNNHFLILILVSILTLAVISFWYWVPKIRNFIDAPDNSRSLISFWLVLIFAFWLISPVLPTVNKAFAKSQKFIQPVPDSANKAVTPENYGGQVTLDFIKNNLPSRVIFESNSAYRDLPMMLDEHMTAWPDYPNPDKEYSKLYEAGVSLMDKLKCVEYGKMDYLLITANKKTFFSPDPRYFTQIYQNNDATIYQVNKGAIQALNLDLSKPPLCRAPQFIINSLEATQ